MQNQPTQLWRSGAEVVIEAATGKLKLGDADSVIKTLPPGGHLVLTGQHMSVTLRRLLLNVSCESRYSGERETFTIAEFLYHNVWDYPLHRPGVRMIDSDGYQHDGENKGWEFDTVFLDGQGRQVPYAASESTLEDHAKTLAWIWFEKLPPGALPQRLILSLDIFSPGHTSGFVRNTEVLEFFLKQCSTRPITRL